MKVVKEDFTSRETPSGRWEKDATKKKKTRAWCEQALRTREVQGDRDRARLDWAFPRQTSGRRAVRYETVAIGDQGELPSGCGSGTSDRKALPRRHVPARARVSAAARPTFVVRQRPHAPGHDFRAWSAWSRRCSRASHTSSLVTCPGSGRPSSTTLTLDDHCAPTRHTCLTHY